MKDVVPVLQRLRWGEIGFANLRFSPFSDQEWTCGEGWLPCDWAGGTIHIGELEYYLDADADPLDPTGLLMQCAVDIAEVSGSLTPVLKFLPCALFPHILLEEKWRQWKVQSFHSRMRCIFIGPCWQCI